jgi:hypothetical protein
MCGFGRVFQLLVISPTAADDVVPLLFCHGFKAIEIVDPFLHRDEGRAVQPGSAPLYRSRLHRLLPGGILRSVLVAREIPTVPMLKGIDRRLQPNGGFDGPANPSGLVDEIASVLSAQPAP